MKLIVSYRKFEAKNGAPICISAGGYEIFTSNLELKNISGSVKFQPDKRDRHGSTAPLIIPIQDATIKQLSEDEINEISDKKLKKALKERLRYRKKNPIPKGIRKEITVQA